MVVVFVDEESKDAAEKLAQRFSLPTTQDEPSGFHLCYEGERLILKDSRQGKSFKIQIDIHAEVSRLKTQRLNYKKDLLCRAMGFKGQASYQIFDGTLGFGKDAFHMLTVGSQVVACEKQPIAFALMEDALRAAPEFSDSFKIFWGDTRSYLRDWAEKIDCLYLDPMFEDVRKKSSPKKQMAFLREISTDYSDPIEIMELGAHLKIKRMVVKRAIKSDYLLAKPNLIFAGNLIRYDVYTR